MKSKAKIVFVDKTPLVMDNDKKYYKCCFVDEDGLTGNIYTDKVLPFGFDIEVELKLVGDKFKFKLSK